MLRFGRHVVLSRLAVGGMGEVFLAATDGRRDQLVVVKQLLPHLSENPAAVRRFEREAEISARLAHPNLVAAEDRGRADGRPYLALEFLRGASLSAMLRAARRRGRPIEPALAAGMARQVCDGLGYAHDLRDPGGQPAGMVHRDLTPSNIFVTLGGVVRVLDFGIARGEAEETLTSTDAARGSVAYMAPEQLARQRVDRRADLFSLGVVLYECLTLERPFERRDRTAPPLDAIEPPALREVVARCLASEPDARWKSAGELAAALDDACADLGGPASPAAIAAALEGDLSGALARQAGQVERALADADATATMSLVAARTDPTLPPREPVAAPAAPPHPLRRRLVLAALYLTALLLGLYWGHAHALLSR